MQDLVHYDPKCKEVALMGIHTLLDGFRWHIQRRAHIHRVNQRFLTLYGKPKIRNLERVSSSQNILRFQVPVQDPLLNQVPTTVNYLFHQLNCAILWYVLVSKSLKVLGHIPVLAHFQHDVNELWRVENVVTLDYALVLKSRVQVDLVTDEFHLVT
jgi:hypothetical protein